MPQSNAEIARQGYEAVRRGDLDAVEDFLDPEVKWHGGDPNAEGACRNRQDALMFMQQARRRGRIGKLVEVIGAGDQVVVIMQPAAQAAKLTANLTTFRDGKAIEMVHYPRPEDALAAAGLTR
jgi:ketosteroid isomerase-like protein